MTYRPGMASFQDLTGEEGFLGHSTYNCSNPPYNGPNPLGGLGEYHQVMEAGLTSFEFPTRMKDPNLAGLVLIAKKTAGCLYPAPIGRGLESVANLFHHRRPWGRKVPSPEMHLLVGEKGELPNLLIPDPMILLVVTCRAKPMPAGSD